MDTLTTTENDFYKQMHIADRCDQCPNGCSQAFVRAVKVLNGKMLEVYLCGHHYREHEPALVASDWLIQDERHRINEKPMSGDPSGRLDDED